MHGSASPEPIRRALRPRVGLRLQILVVTALLVISMYSRLYLGVHWPTDVLGGLAVGAVWLAATLFAFGGHRQGRTMGAERASAQEGNPRPARPLSLPES